MTAPGRLAVTSSGAHHQTAADRGDKKREDPEAAAVGGQWEHRNRIRRYRALTQR